MARGEKITANVEVKQLRGQLVGWVMNEWDDAIAENNDRGERQSWVQGVKSSVKERSR